MRHRKSNKNLGLWSADPRPERGESLTFLSQVGALQIIWQIYIFLRWGETARHEGVPGAEVEKHSVISCCWLWRHQERKAPSRESKAQAQRPPPSSFQGNVQGVRTDLLRRDQLLSIRIFVSTEQWITALLVSILLTNMILSKLSVK